MPKKFHSMRTHITSTGLPSSSASLAYLRERQARDTFFGGALLLTSGGIFYLSAPSYTVSELSFGKEEAAGSTAEEEGMKDAERPIYLIPHAYYLFQKASLSLGLPSRSDMQDGGGQANLSADAAAAGTFLSERMRAFSYDCLLHMLLNDLVRAATYFEVAQQEGPTSSGLDPTILPCIRKHLTALLSLLIGAGTKGPPHPPPHPAENAGWASSVSRWWGGKGAASKPSTVARRPDTYSKAILDKWLVGAPSDSVPAGHLPHMPCTYS
jgi:hypothetical protein